MRLFMILLQRLSSSFETAAILAKPVLVATMLTCSQEAHDDKETSADRDEFMLTGRKEGKNANSVCFIEDMQLKINQLPETKNSMYI